jgi:hypothetical protein
MPGPSPATSAGDLAQGNRLVNVLRFGLQRHA